MKKLFLILPLLCLSIAAYAAYTVRLKLPSDLDGAMLYLYTGTYKEGKSPIDSLTVVDSTAVFTGEIPYATTAVVRADGSNVATLFLENDTVDIEVTREIIPGGVATYWKPLSGKLNSARRVMWEKLREIREKYAAAPNDSVKEILKQEYSAVYLKALEDNADNVFGAELAIDLKRGRDYFEAHPALMQLDNVKEYLARQEEAEKISPGKPFRDFTVTYNGTTHRLSDVVGKGDYVLLDFWAAWCAPCIRPMAHLKELHEKYGKRNFRILGVPINDDPENTLYAVEELSLPWEIWPGKDNVEAYKAYMIEGIPHAVLFTPDGTILLNKPSTAALDAKLFEIFGK